MIKKPGRQPSRSEQLLLRGLIKKVYGPDVGVIVHHITEDTPHKLQLEVEWQTHLGPRFERIFL